jgi:hypothetical protein
MVVVESTGGNHLEQRASDSGVARYRDDHGHVSRDQRNVVGILAAHVGGGYWTNLTDRRAAIPVHRDRDVLRQQYSGRDDAGDVEHQRCRLSEGLVTGIGDGVGRYRQPPGTWPQRLGVLSRPDGAIGADHGCRPEQLDDGEMTQEVRGRRIDSIYVADHG